MKHSARRADARLLALFALFALLVLAPANTPAQDTSAPAYKISYSITTPQPSTHLFNVRVEVSGLAGAGYVDFQMPRWSPGRYAVFDFAKNVQEVRALGPCDKGERCGSKSYEIERLDTQTWRVGTHDADRLSFSYRVFGDDLSGTFSQLDERHANFNGGSVFVYVVGHKQDPVILSVSAPDGWKVINGYSTRDDQREFQFPNYDVMIDAPTEIAPDFTVQKFEVEGKTYRVVVHSLGPEGHNRDELVRGVERIVRAEVATMGPPEFDQYTFLFHFAPNERRGDGMEHLNSTQIVETGALAERRTLESALDGAAHEFFHVWNVKRLRPVGLGPWDFTKPVVTRGLWIAEGFTNYYGKLSLERAGLWTQERLLDSYARNITGTENAPGTRLMSAVESSLLAPFLDRGSNDQRTNLENTSISYYPKGETLGLVLDLLIRGRSHGRVSLDDVMRRAYEEFYLKSPNDSYYLKGRAYTVEDFERVASETAGSDLSDFFRFHVYGTVPPPYEEALAYVGLRFIHADEHRPTNAGLNVVADDTPRRRARVGAVQMSSPADSSGIKAGDVIVSIDGKDVTAADWLAALNSNTSAHVSLVVLRDGKSVSLDLALPPAQERTTYRIEEDKNATSEARALRETWLKGRR
ncbi:MAG TPA: PDZ domain-containing protein [Pyrinomonadaceae bacterium]|nr:PDZ domain-containing protein [Pyrinomonadaceae bacterium]